MSSPKRLLALAACLAYAALNLAAAFAAESSFPALLYVPPVVLNLLLCALFGATLREGREPIITRFARIERGEPALPPDLQRYTRALTVAWSAFFATMAALSVGLALWGSHFAWALFTNVLNYLAVVLFFAAEYLYRRIRFRHHRHASPGEILRRLHTYRPFGN